jgi:flagellar biosynthesis/type III secretory pathway protein FliH
VPRLHTEKAVSIKVHPSMAATVRQKLYQVLSDKQSNFDLKECAGLSAGDIQMDWQDGRAIRDTTQLHTDIMQILHKFGISGAACRIDG